MGLGNDLKKKHGFDSPAQEAYLQLVRTYHGLAHRFDRLFRHHGLSESTYNILRILRGVHRYPENGQQDLPCHEVAQRLVTPVPDLTRLLDRLERAGLVERRRSQSDRRVVRAEITQEGLDKLSALDEPVAQLHERTLGHMSTRELTRLSELLTKARQNQSGIPETTTQPTTSD